MPPIDRIVPDAWQPPPPATAEPPTAMQTRTTEDAVRLLRSPLHRTIRALAGTRIHRRYRPPAMAALVPTSYDSADHAAAPAQLATKWGVPRRSRSWRDRVHDPCAGARAKPAAPPPRCPLRRPSPTASNAAALMTPASAAAVSCRGSPMRSRDARVDRTLGRRTVRQLLHDVYVVIGSITAPY